jgi:hypothetical protein
VRDNVDINPLPFDCAEIISAIAFVPTGTEIMIHMIFIPVGINNIEQINK